jgi:hypothetical protein
MGLDITNGYLRYDNASASNIYYGYNQNQNASDSDNTWLIRRVKTTNNVTTITWANGSETSYNSNWTNRSSYFSVPSGNMGFTYSKSGNYISCNWNAINGIDKYTITSNDVNGYILNRSGYIISTSQNGAPQYTDLVSGTAYSLCYLSSGTYSVTLVGISVSGTTASTYTVNI